MPNELIGESYVLITAARNEEAHIPKTLQSVIGQSLLPKTWVIVDDGSTDRTAEIVMDLASRYDFIRLIRRRDSGLRGTSTAACNVGYDEIRHMDFGFACFLDADVSFGGSYFENILGKFKANPRLGIAGGQILEYHRGSYVARSGNSTSCVAGAVQFFRRRCFEDIGEHLMPVRHGGHDTVANFMARQKGWEVRSFSEPDLRVLHHRPTGTAGHTLWEARFRQGRQDYFLGYNVLFEAGKCVRRAAERPYVLGSLLRLGGYLLPCLTLQKRDVPDNFLPYLRRDLVRRVFQDFLGRQE